MTEREANIRINVRGNATEKLGELQAKARALGVEFDRQGRARAGNRWISRQELESLVKAGRSLKDIGTEAKKAAAEVRRVGSESRGLGGALEGAASSFARSGLAAELGKVNKGFGALDAQLSKTFGNLPFLQNFTSAAGAIETGVTAIMGAFQVGATVAAVGVGAVAAGLFLAVREASEVETAMSRVRAATAGSRTEMEALTASAMRLGSATQYSAAEVAAVQENFAKAGFNVGQILSASSGTLSFAAATDTDTGFASSLIAQTVRAMGFRAQDAGAVGDSLVIGSQASNVDVTDLAEALKYAAPVFASMGRSNRNVAMNDMVALTGILGDQGIRGSMAGTALRSGYGRLAAPTARAQSALRELGVSTTSASGDMRRLPEILADLRTSLEGRSTGDSSSMLTRIFGVESASAFGAIINADASRFGELVSALEDSGGAADRTARIMNDNLMGDLEQLGGAISGLGTTIGTQLLPSIRDSIVDVTSLVGALDSTLTATQLAESALGTDGLGGVISWFSDTAITAMENIIVGASELLGPLMPGGGEGFRNQFSTNLVTHRIEQSRSETQRTRDAIEGEARSTRLGLRSARGRVSDAQGGTGSELAADARERLTEAGLGHLAQDPRVAGALAELSGREGPIRGRRQRSAALRGVLSSLDPVVSEKLTESREQTRTRLAQVDVAEQQATRYLEGTENSRRQGGIPGTVASAQQLEILRQLSRHLERIAQSTGQTADNTRSREPSGSVGSTSNAGR